MAPALPTVLAALLWVCEGDRTAVLVIVLILKAGVLVGTGLLVLRLIRETTSRVGIGVATLIYVLAMLVLWGLDQMLSFRSREGPCGRPRWGLTQRASPTGC
jgi:hypothetical protein